MGKSSKMIEIPKALFEDDEINADRGAYIIRYMKFKGKELPSRLAHQYGYYMVPQSIIVEARKGSISLSDLTFLLACYYTSSENNNKNIRMDEVFQCITRNWDEFRTRNAAERLNLTLSSIDGFTRWIKKYDHNNKYYVKY
jgi:hypothetical protein